VARGEKESITKTGEITGEILVKYYLLIIAILVFSGACSSNLPANQTTGGTNSAANSDPANANTAAATNSNPAIQMQPYNGVQNINSNAFNATSDNLKVIPYQPKKDELPYGTRNAPDDSIVSSGSRGRDFVETRTFKNHPILSKVEKIMDGKTTKYKVYLKSGKVVDAPADKLSNYTAMAPNSILDAIGMKPQLEPNQQMKPEVKEAQKP
jgi:hypothetical protein